jgi:hypothetical protein
VISAAGGPFTSEVGDLCPSRGEHVPGLNPLPPDVLAGEL